MNLSLNFYTIVDSLIHFYLFLDLLFILIIYSFLFIFSFECQDTVKCDGWDYDLSMGLTTVSIACVADDIGDIDNIGYFVSSEGALYVILPYDYQAAARPLFEHTPVLNNNFEY